MKHVLPRLRRPTAPRMPLRGVFFLPGPGFFPAAGVVLPSTLPTSSELALPGSLIKSYFRFPAAEAESFGLPLITKQEILAWIRMKGKTFFFFFGFTSVAQAWDAQRWGWGQWAQRLKKRLHPRLCPHPRRRDDDCGCPVRRTRRSLVALRGHRQRPHCPSHPILGSDPAARAPQQTFL